jgi:hypothetical protein
MNRLLDIDRVLDEWLALGPDELPDEVLDRVSIEIEAMPQRRSAWARGATSANRLLVIGTVAAAIAAVAVGVGLFAGRNVGGPEPTPTPASLSLIAADGWVLEPGAYVVDGPFPSRISFSVPSGWYTYAAVDEHLAAVCKGTNCAIGLSFWIIDNLPVDGCDLSLGYLDPPVGPSVDDLATALVAQPGYLATGPTPTSMSGFTGEYLELVGQGIPAGGCFERTTWTIGPHWRRSMHEEADQIWILDVGGTRLVVDAFATREAAPADRAELQAMVDTIHIEAP